MDYNKEHIDNLFKKGLGDYTEAPPPAAWDALEKRLDGANSRKVFFWPWFSNNRKGFLLGVLGVLLVSSGLLFFNRNTSGNMAAVHFGKPVNTPVAVQALNNPSTINTATNTQDNINTNQTKTASTLSKRNRIKTTISDIHNSSTSGIDKTVNEQVVSDDGIAATNNENSEAEKNSVIGANVAPTQPEAMLTTQATDKGNIHIEQEVVEKQQERNNKPNDILLASNAGGEVATMKRHGIVVQSLPDEQIAHPQAVIYHSPSAVTETIASTNKAEKDDKKATKNIIKPLPTVAGAAEKPVVVKQVYEAINSKSVVKKALVAKKGKTINAPVIAAEAIPAQKKNPIVAAKVKPAKSLAAKTKPAIIPASKIVKSKKNLVAEKKNVTPASRSIAQNSKPVKMHKQTRGITARKQKQTTPQIAAQSAPATAFMQPSAANTFSGNKLAQAILPKAAITNNVTATQLIPTRTFNDLPTTPVANINTPLLTAIGGANPGTDTTAAKKHRRFEYGIKAGYEGGFTNETAHKIVGAPYIQYNLGSRFSIMSQPAFKTASVSNRALSGTQTFYSVDQNSSNVKLDSTVYMLVIGAPGTPVDTFTRRYYSYSQERSIVNKSYQYGGTYFEFEIPLLLKYALTKNLSIYGGPDVVYGKTIDVTEVTKTGSPITTIGHDTTITHGSQATQPPPISSIIKYSGTPLSGYKGPLYPSSSGDLLRLGYMLGASYELNKRYLFDALIEQSGAPANNEGGYNVNKPLSSLYFRFTIGYRLSK